MNNKLPTLLTLEEAAYLLRTSVDELRAEFELGRIPGVRIGNSWRVHSLVLKRMLGLTASDAPSSPPLQNEHSQVQLVSRSGSQAPKQEDNLKCNDSSTTPPFDGNVLILLPEKAPVDKTSFQETPQNPIIPAGYERAVVFSFNTLSKEGRARDALGKIVVFHTKDFLSPVWTVLPKAIIEYQPVANNGGLKALKIKLISSEASSHSPLIPVSDLPSSKIHSEQKNHFSGKVPERPSQSNKAKIFYERASAAQNEQRYDAARQLYQQAIAAGGGTQVYSAYYKMERSIRHLEEAQRIIEQAIKNLPAESSLYDLYAQTERRAGNYRKAEEILRRGLAHLPPGTTKGKRSQLLQGLSQVLVDIGTETSFSEAQEIYKELERLGKLNRSDGVYLRFLALGSNEIAKLAFNFFKSAKLSVGIASRKERDLRSHITDLVVSIQSQEFREYFGLNGSFLVRCFRNIPSPYEIADLSKQLQEMGPRTVVTLLNGPPAVLNPSVAFIVVSDNTIVHDQVLSITHDTKEVIVPVDKSILSNATPNEILVSHIGQYLGRRNLYMTRKPVWGKYFFGRESYLLRLIDGVKQGEFLGVYGLRKMGKTSLVRQLSDEQLKGEAVAFVDLQALTGYFDNTEDCTALYWKIEQTLYERVREQYPQAAELLQLALIKRFEDFPHTGPKTASVFNDDLNLLLQKIVATEIPNLYRIVVVLDEIEGILPISRAAIKGYMEFFQILRGLSQTYPGRLSNVIVAANAAISERGYWEGKENPVFAFYSKIFLSPFSEQECEQMIRELGKGMSVYWEDEAISLVYHETGGHPFLTRAFCAFITRKHDSRPLTITSEIVNGHIISFIYEEGDILKQVLGLVKENFPEDGRLLEEMALGRPFTQNSEKLFEK